MKRLLFLSRNTNYFLATVFLTEAFFLETFGAGCSPAFKAGLRGVLTRFGLSIVLKQEVQSLSFIPSIALACRLIPCLFKVFILEWERLAPLVATLLHRSHFLPIFVGF